MDEKNNAIREKIIDEFHRLVLLQGYNHTTLRQLADACGMSKGHVGFYFKIKEDIMIAQKTRFLHKLSTVLDKYAPLREDACLHFAFFTLAFMFILNQRQDLYIHMAEMSRNSIYLNWRLRQTYDAAVPVFVDRGVCNHDDLLAACFFSTYGLYGSIQHAYSTKEAFDHKRHFRMYLSAFFALIGFSQGDAYMEKAFQVFDAFDKEAFMREMYPDIDRPHSRLRD